MNKERRAAVARLADRVNDVRLSLAVLAEEEREYFENMPESIQSSERGEAADEQAGALEDGAEALEELEGTLREVLEA